MRILFDHCLVKQLRPYILGHEVILAKDMGWDQLSNGRLLSAAEEAGFEVLVTADQRMRFEQNFSGRKIRVIVIASRSNTLKSMLPAVPGVLSAIDEMSAGQVIVVKSY